LLVLLVLLVGLRRHPQEQYVCTAVLSEKWLYCLPKSDRNAGPIPIPTGAGVTCSPGKGCIGPESTTAQYVAYGETTVHPYLCIFYVSPVLGTFNSTSSFTPKSKKG
jgi:hypothetical protein